MQLRRSTRQLIVVAVILGAPLRSSGEPSKSELASRVIIVRDGTVLAAALAEAQSGDTVLLVPGTYLIERPLTVPDAVTLAGTDPMGVDDTGTPRRHAPGEGTILRAERTFGGEVVSLGDRAVIADLRIEDLRGAAVIASSQSSNAVAVVSRRPGDRISAKVERCEILVSGPTNANSGGPTGRGIVVLTWNGEGAHPAHEDAQVAVAVTQSHVRTPSLQGNAVFANNFATRGRVAVILTNNLIEGSLVVGGGTSRRQSVTDAVAAIVSRHNRYASGDPENRSGWSLIGASGAPHAHSPIPGTSGNHLSLTSTDDRIEGFRTAIQAAGGRRTNPWSGPISDNVADLDIERLVIVARDPGAIDLSLHGALYAPTPGQPTDGQIGSGNRLHVSIRESRGSGRRANLYGDRSGMPGFGPDPTDDNRLELSGSAAEFARSNQGFDPLPPASHFADRPGQNDSEVFRSLQDP